MEKLNTAQQLYQSLGAAFGGDPKQAHGNRNNCATKSGPGRYHKGGKPGTRIAKPRAIRAYVALLTAWAAKVRPNWSGERDPESGAAITRVGRDGMGERRIWLAGISAQRGF